MVNCDQVSKTFLLKDHLFLNPKSQPKKLIMHERKSVDQHRPNSTCGVSFMEQGQNPETKVKSQHVEAKDLSAIESGGVYAKPLACFGCGIGWFSFLFGFVFPPLWFYATVLYFGNHYLKDPRERPGLAASAIAALICSVTILVSLIAVFW